MPNIKTVCYHAPSVYFSTVQPKKGILTRHYPAPENLAQNLHQLTGKSKFYTWE